MASKMWEAFQCRAVGVTWLQSQHRFFYSGLPNGPLAKVQPAQAAITNIAIVCLPLARLRAHHPIRLEHRLDPPHRLADAGFVFDQGKAHMLIAVVTKADAGGHRHLGLG